MVAMVAVLQAIATALLATFICLFGIAATAIALGEDRRKKREGTGETIARLHFDPRDRYVQDVPVPGDAEVGIEDVYFHMDQRSS